MLIAIAYEGANFGPIFKFVRVIGSKMRIASTTKFLKKKNSLVLPCAGSQGES